MTHRALLVFALAWGAWLLPAGANAPTAPAEQPHAGSSHVSRVAYLMGTRATLVTFDADRTRGAERLERLLEVLEETESELSTWRDDSVLTRLNRAPAGRPFALSPSLCALFASLEHWTSATAGAFDPAVGPLSASWGLHDRPRAPGAGEVEAARRRSGWRQVGFDRERCHVTRAAGASIDVGGFGKGEALDRAVAAAGDDPFPWMIDLGGQVQVSGTPPDAPGWVIDLADPRRRTRAVGSVVLGSGSIATSGGSERDARVNGTRVGHILDPGTGHPASYDGSVVVWHERGLVADILSTALYVMGPARGLQWADTHQVAAAYLSVEHDAVRLLPSESFTRRFGRVRHTAG